MKTQTDLFKSDGVCSSIRNRPAFYPVTESLPCWTGEDGICLTFKACCGQLGLLQRYWKWNLFCNWTCCLWVSEWSSNYYGVCMAFKV